MNIHSIDCDFSLNKVLTFDSEHDPSQKPKDQHWIKISASVRKTLWEMIIAVPSSQEIKVPVPAWSWVRVKESEVSDSNATDQNEHLDCSQLEWWSSLPGLKVQHKF